MVKIVRKMVKIVHFYLELELEVQIELEFELEVQHPTCTLLKCNLMFKNSYKGGCR